MSRGDGKAGMRREVITSLARSIKLSEQSINLRGTAQQICAAFDLNFDDLNDRAAKLHEKQQASGTVAA